MALRHYSVSRALGHRPRTLRADRCRRLRWAGPGDADRLGPRDSERQGVPAGFGPVKEDREPGRLDHPPHLDRLPPGLRQRPERVAVLAHEARSVPGLIPRRLLKNSSVTLLMR